MLFAVIFAVFFRTLWLVSSIATGTLLPFYTLQMDRVSACAHGEVNVILFASSVQLDIDFDRNRPLCSNFIYNV